MAAHTDTVQSDQTGGTATHTYRWLVAGDSGHGRRKRKGQECEYRLHLQVVGGWRLWPWEKEEEGSGV